MDIDTQQLLIALAAGVPSFLLGFLTYRRSRKADAITEQSGVADNTRAGIAQAIEALNLVTANLREDNKVLREHERYMTARHEKAIAHCEETTRQLDHMRRKHPENGLPKDV